MKVEIEGTLEKKDVKDLKPSFVASIFGEKKEAIF
jgi:hypothetical protein